MIVPNRQWIDTTLLPPFNRLNYWQIEWRARGNSFRQSELQSLFFPSDLIKRTANPIISITITVLEKPLSAWCSVRTMRTCPPLLSLLISHCSWRSGGGGEGYGCDLHWAKLGEGGVNSEQWSELIIVMPQQIDSRDVCLRHKSPSNKSLMLSLLQVECLGFYSITGADSSVWNTEQQLCKSTLKVYTPQQNRRKQSHSNQFKWVSHNVHL